MIKINSEEITKLEADFLNLYFSTETGGTFTIPEGIGLERCGQLIDLVEGEDMRGSIDSCRCEDLKYDGGKLLVTLVQPSFIKGVAEVLTFGANKYKPNSWQTVSDGKRRYEDALYRHWLAYLDGEEVDEESGLEHLKHLACNAMFLLYLNSTKESK